MWIYMQSYIMTQIKNRFYQNKFGVKWVSKMSARNCAVCKALFRSVSLRKAMRKHHCRSCGRVVCMPCSPSKIEMKVNYITKILFGIYFMKNYPL